MRRDQEGRRHARVTFAISRVPAGRLLAVQLFGVKTSDPVILVSAAVMLGACATIAGAIPAARASGVDPVEALRVND